MSTLCHLSHVSEEVVSVTGCVHTLRHPSHVSEEVVSVTGCVHTLCHLSHVREEVVTVTGCVTCQRVVMCTTIVPESGVFQLTP